MHVYIPRPSVQLPFRQGLLAHSSISATGTLYAQERRENKGVGREGKDINVQEGKRGGGGNDDDDGDGLEDYQTHSGTILLERLTFIVRISNLDF